jgi:threonine/homoserine/homoserine lactone efflux protein
MPSATTLAAFTAATVALIALPGPANVYILSRGLSAGRRVAFVSALGIETGTVVFVVLTAFGLAAVIAASNRALETLHYLGAAYLFFLAWRAWRSRAELAIPEAGPRTESLTASYRQGFLVGISNPKVAIFFLAFFPQFVQPRSGSTTSQILVLGAVFTALGLCADALNSCASAAVGRWLARRPAIVRARSKLEAAAFFGVGAWVLVSGSPRRVR